MVDRSSRVLIFQLEDWLGCVRMPAALQHAGFEVAALCPENVHLARTRHLDRRYVYSATVSRSLLQRVRRTAESFAPRVTGLVRRALAPAVERVIDAERSGPRMLSFLADAIQDWRPGFVLCGDEATRRLMCSAVLAANAGRSPLADDVLDVVRASAGNPRFFEQTNRKSVLMEFCLRQGYPAPASQVVTRPGEVDSFAALHGYPVMLKLDFQAGGWGVIASSSPEQTRDAMSRMAEVFSWTPMKASAADEVAVSADGVPALSVQKRIDGRSHNVCVAAIDGKVLASFTFYKRMVTSPNAPSSVVQFVYDEETDRIARRLIEHLGFTGICEAEFIVERETAKPYLIELNPRPAPSCHLGSHFGADLSRALRAALGGPPYEARIPADLNWTVALFPQEWLRDPDSQLLSQAHHDVPWDDPALIENLCGGPSQARRFRAQFQPPL